MKFIIVLDDQNVIVAKPEELQLRQIQPGVTALALPAGKDENGAERILPLVSYPVNLTLPPTPPAPETKPTEVKKAKKKASK